MLNHSVKKFFLFLMLFILFPTHIFADDKEETRDDYKISSSKNYDWLFGFCYKYTITNTSWERLYNWKIKFNLEDANIYSTRGGKFYKNSSSYYALGYDYNSPLEVGASTEVWYCAYGRGRPNNPSFYNENKDLSCYNKTQASCTVGVRNGVCEFKDNYCRNIVTGNTLWLTITNKITSDWRWGFCQTYSIKNNTRERIYNWEIKYSLDAPTYIYDVWWGNFYRYWGTSQYKINGTNRNNPVEPWQSFEVWYCASGYQRPYNISYSDESSDRNCSGKTQSTCSSWVRNGYCIWKNNTCEIKKDTDPPWDDYTCTKETLIAQVTDEILTNITTGVSNQIVQSLKGNLQTEVIKNYKNNLSSSQLASSLFALIGEATIKEYIKNEVYEIFDFLKNTDSSTLNCSLYTTSSTCSAGFRNGVCEWKNNSCQKYVKPNLDLSLILSGKVYHNRWCGYCYAFTLNNNKNQRIFNWNIGFQLSGSRIYTTWGWKFLRSGNTYRVTWLNRNNPLNIGQKVEIGFCAFGWKKPENMSIKSDSLSSQIPDDESVSQNKCVYTQDEINALIEYIYQRIKANLATTVTEEINQSVQTQIQYIEKLKNMTSSCTQEGNTLKIEFMNNYKLIK